MIVIQNKKCPSHFKEYLQSHFKPGPVCAFKENLQFISGKLVRIMPLLVTVVTPAQCLNNTFIEPNVRVEPGLTIEALPHTDLQQRRQRKGKKKGEGSRLLPNL